MTTSAIVMMLVAIVTIWGGLVAAIVNLAHSPDEPVAEDHGQRDL